MICHDLKEAESHWRKIEATSSHYVFQTYDWLNLWVETCGAVTHGGVEPHVVCHRDVVFPLGIYRWYGCKVLCFLGGEVTDYQSPLVSQRFNPLHIRSVWQSVVRMIKPDIVWLNKMPARFPDGTRNPMLHLASAYQSDNAYYATLPSQQATAGGPKPDVRAPEARENDAGSKTLSIDDFMAGRSKRYFEDTRRKRRKLRRRGNAMLALPYSAEKIDTAVRLMLAQKQQRFIDTSAGSTLTPAVERFYIGLAHTKLAHIAYLQVNTQETGDEIIATHLGALYQDRFYWLMPGFDNSSEWSSYSVGRLLLLALVEWCILVGAGDHDGDRRAIKVFDLTIGDEEYKRFWANNVMPLFSARYPVTTRGYLTLTAQGITSRLRQKLGEAQQAGA